MDTRTVASWRDRVGAHCQQVHQALVETGKLDLLHVQADEIGVKGRQMIAWMGLAMMVSTRLWLAGTVRMSRDKGLAEALMQQVRRTAQPLRPLLVVTDGWAAYAGSIGRAFREKVKKVAGVGRAALRNLTITLIHRFGSCQIRASRRHFASCPQQALALLGLSKGGQQ
jgi:hypothetical protein